LDIDISYKLGSMAWPVGGGGGKLRNGIFSADVVERGCYLVIRDSFY
jgi:hypothetical protein